MFKRILSSLLSATLITAAASGISGVATDGIYTKENYVIDDSTVVIRDGKVVSGDASLVDSGLIVIEDDVATDAVVENTVVEQHDDCSDSVCTEHDAPVAAPTNAPATEVDTKAITPDVPTVGTKATYTAPDGVAMTYDGAMNLCSTHNIFNTRELTSGNSVWPFSVSGTCNYSTSCTKSAVAYSYFRPKSGEAASVSVVNVNGANLAVICTNGNYALRRNEDEYDRPLTGPMFNLKSGRLILDGQSDYLTVTGRNAPDVVNSIITMSGGTLLINKTKLLNNNNTSKNGGAIRATGGTIKITNSTIDNCHAVNGGAIHVSGSCTITLTNVTISNCSAKGGSGGGLYVGSDSTLHFNSSDIRTCSASNGGGIRVENGTFNLNSGTIGGSADYANTATTSGAGVYLGPSSAAGTTVFKMSGGEVSYNVNSGGNGGGIWCGAVKTFSITGGTITENQTTVKNGAGIFFNRSLVNAANITGCTISNNKSPKEGGGGIYIGNNSGAGTGGLTINIGNSTTTTTISGNTGVWGAGIYVYTESAAPVNLNVNNVSITNNIATAEGGGIYVVNSANALRTFEVNNCTLTGNQGTLGGGIYVAPSTYGTLDFSNSTFTNCSATAKYGGGVCIDGETGVLKASSIVLDGCDFNTCFATAPNSSRSEGGAIYVGGLISSISWNGGSAVGCEAGAGSAIMVNGDGVAYNLQKLNGGTLVTHATAISNFDIRNVNFEGNENNYTGTGAAYGAAIKTEGKVALVMRLTGCTFNGNQNNNINGTAINGGGIYWNAGTSYKNGEVYSGSSATKSYDAAYYVEASALYIDGCQFYDNQVNNAGSNGGSGSGGGIYNEATIVITNSAFHNNSAVGRGGGIAMQNYSNTNGKLPDDLSLTLDDTVSFFENTAQRGGAISFHCRSAANLDPGYKIPFKLVLEGSKIYNNYASIEGGGIYFYSEENSNDYFEYGIELKEGQIYNNKAGYTYVNGVETKLTAGYGGAIYASSFNKAYTINITGGTIGGYFGADGAKTPNEAVTNGGAICLMTPYLTLNMTGGEISENIAGADGGGIYANESSATFTGGSILYNTANRGGGVFIDNKGTLTMNPAQSTDSSGNPVTTRVSVSRNVAYSGGGGIFLNDEGASATIKDGVISYNRALGTNGGTGNGGGIATWKGTVSIQGGELYGNEALQNGGAIMASSSPATVTITGGTIGSDTDAELANKAARGGGVAVQSGAEFSLSDGCIGYNKALITTDERLVLNDTNTGLGGGVYVHQSNADITGGTIVGNRADNNGGGIYVYSSDNTRGVIFSGGTIGEKADGTAIPNIANYGGGVYVLSAKFSMTKDEGVAGAISHNVAIVDGGGLYVSLTSVSIAGDISDNIARHNGGGVYLEKAAIDLEGNISNNKAGYAITVDGEEAVDGQGDGGGIYIYESFHDNTVNETVINGTVSDNIANNNGGGIYAVYGSSTDDVTVQLNGSLTDNTAKQSGGGAYITGGIKFTMAKQAARSSEVNSLSGNVATEGNGGGVAAYDNSVATLSGGLIENNSALNGFGGGVYANRSTVTISGSDITKNNAKNGGGVAVTQGGDLVMTGGFLRYNNAKGMPDDTVTTSYHLDSTLAGVGGGIYLSNGVDAELLSSYELTGETYGIYGNLADFAADDVFANGVNTKLKLPAALSMKLAGTEFERATGWFEDYATDDTRYSDGLNGNSYIGGARYKQTERTVIAYVNAEDAGEHATDTMVYINTANTYVCLTLGVAKAGYGEITIIKSGENIDPEQVFLFKIIGISEADNKRIELSVTIKGTGAVTITDVPDGSYTVTEVADWSWRYKLTGIKVTNGTIKLNDCCGNITVGYADASPDIEFINAFDRDPWLDGNSSVVVNRAGASPINTLPEAAVAQFVADLPRKEDLI